MVPAAFVVLDAMPLNANGKVDRARLPEPGPSAYARDVRVEPADDRERALWAIWKDVLGIDAFGVTDSFFAVGGDSILAIQIASRAVRQGLAVQPRQVIEQKTIRALAATLAPAAAAAEPAAPAVAINGEQRLLPIQLRFLQGDRGDMNRYGQYAEIGLPAGVDETMLFAALEALVAHHDVLRLKFRETGAGWIAQYRADPMPVAEMLEAVDAADADAIERAEAGLDIKQGRLCRWLWLRGTAESKLLWFAHHLVVDGVSWRVLVDDLQAVLGQLARSEAGRRSARRARAIRRGPRPCTSTRSAPRSTPRRRTGCASSRCRRLACRWPRKAPIWSSTPRRSRSRSTPPRRRACCTRRTSATAPRRATC